MKSATRKSSDELWQWAAQKRSASHAAAVERALAHQPKPTQRWTLSQVTAFLQKLLKPTHAKPAKGR